MTWSCVADLGAAPGWYAANHLWAARGRVDRWLGGPGLRGRPDRELRVAGPGGLLTPREMDVLRLVAAGRSNRAIAETLFISVNTVERHVRHVFGKLEVPNRAAATAHAVRAGLTCP